MEEIRFVHNEMQHRYELHVDDALASVAEYRSEGGPEGDVLVFHHTETTPRFQGRGFAAQVVGFALEDVAQRGQHVHPTCWFVADFISTHPAYQPLMRDRTNRAAS